MPDSSTTTSGAGARPRARRRRPRERLTERRWQTLHGVSERPATGRSGRLLAGFSSRSRNLCRGARAKDVRASARQASGMVTPPATRGALWLPFTQMQDALVRRFVRGSGSTLVDDSGRSVFDATSSIWTIVHGHGHPAIVEAIARQAAELDHATLLGASNPRAEELAERLCALCGPAVRVLRERRCERDRSGASRWRSTSGARAAPERTRFVRLVSAYHGDTLGGDERSSDIGAFKDAYRDVTFESIAYDGTRFRSDSRARRRGGRRRRTGRAGPPRACGSYRMPRTRRSAPAARTHRS